LKDRDYPREIIWGIAAQESDIVDFDNQFVSYDYGHGIMQITFDAYHDTLQNQSATYDNRGIGSYITIYPCPSVSTTTYTKCHTEGGSTSTNAKPYKHYDDIQSNPKYKQYTNTRQSIYSNVKDGMGVLEEKFEALSQITTTTIASGTTYSSVEREVILITERYNGNNCGYVDEVADRLDEIDAYFSGKSSSTVSSTIQKMHTAGTDMVCADLNSPGDLTITDSQDRVLGVVNGEERNDFEWGIYDQETESAKILFPNRDENYRYRVVGTGEGVYGLDITIKEGPRLIVYRVDNVQTNLGEIHTYNLDKEAILNGEGGVVVEIDKDGNGLSDEILNGVAELKYKPNPEPRSALDLSDLENTELQASVTWSSPTINTTTSTAIYE
jgi:hypothetical protein